MCARSIRTRSGQEVVRSFHKIVKVTKDQEGRTIQSWNVRVVRFNEESTIVARRDRIIKSEIIKVMRSDQRSTIIKDSYDGRIKCVKLVQFSYGP